VAPDSLESTYAPLLIRCFKMRFMVRKLTKAKRRVDEQMLAIIEWAAGHPKHWHNIGPLPASKQAAAMLEQRGVIEIWWERINTDSGTRTSELREEARTSRIVMIGAWVLDLLWLPLMYYGSPTLRTVGFIGFGASLVVWLIALSIYNRGKARQRP
jgi:hypothetical protein